MTITLPRADDTVAATKAATKLARSRRRLQIATLVFALIAGVGLPALVQPVNLFKVAGFPLGFYIAAEGAPLLLGVALFVYARRANRLDRSIGPAAGERR